jgi:hypothetical protein
MLTPIPVSTASRTTVVGTRAPEHASSNISLEFSNDRVSTDAATVTANFEAR